MSASGAIAISVDEEERSALVAICDVNLRPENRLPNITVKRASVTGHKVINPGVVDRVGVRPGLRKGRVHQWQGRDAFTERRRDPRYNSFVRQSRQIPTDQWQVLDLAGCRFPSSRGSRRTVCAGELGDGLEDAVNEFVLTNAESVVPTCDG